MPEVKLSDDRSYGFIVGGIHLTENGKPVTSILPTCVYNDMNGTHVQTMWAFFKDNPVIQKALADFSAAMGDELNALGDTYMVSTGKADERQMKEFGEMLKRHFSKK